MDAQPIANRCTNGDDFELPRIVQVVSLGEIEDDVGSVHVIDRVAIHEMLKQFRSDGAEVLIDFDFDSLDRDKRTTAAGWIISAEARSDGLFATVRWSRSGAEAVQGGMFRFVAPNFVRAECEQISANHSRPLRLNGVALTNRPRVHVVGQLLNRSDDATISKGDAVAAWNNLVGKIRTDRKVSFTAAWESAKLAGPEIWQRFASGSIEGGSLSNRTQEEKDIATWARETGRNPKDYPVASQTTVGCAVTNWNLLVAGLQREEDLTFERSWEKAKIKDARAWVQYRQEAEKQAEELERRVNNL